MKINKNNTQKKKFEFNNKNNTKRNETEAGNNITKNSATSLNEEIKALISAIKSSNELMEKRQKNIDKNFAKLVETQGKTNYNIIETNNMLKVFLKS